MPKSYLTLAQPPGDYATVAERLALFWERFPRGRVVTRLVSRSEREVTFRALLYRSPDETAPAATGWASEREGDGEVNAVACLENTETSAVGRALANLGFAARQGAAGRPSAEEVAKGGAARARRGTLVVREGVAGQGVGDAAGAAGAATRGVDEELQRRAAAALDALALLEKADRAGMPHVKVATLRARLTEPGIPLPLIEQTERMLRAWLGRRRPPAGD
ncbi:MAG: hypothetical protein ACJ79S_02825 [Gemmatimonadaceae bacterium]